jgi:uncharacterized SAM-binding protein YcdF (DUF218 family)
MNSVVRIRPAARHTWLVLAGFGVSALVAWALAGCFMNGEDNLGQPAPYLVVLGGGVAGERDLLACQLFSQGNGSLGVLLTGGNSERFVPNRTAFLKRCGIPSALVKHWPDTSNSYEEMSAVKQFLVAMPGVHAIVVSDALHMPRLRYLRDRLALNGRVFFRQSQLGWRLNPHYLFGVVVFWFREPLAYVFYRLRY